MRLPRPATSQRCVELGSEVRRLVIGCRRQSADHHARAGRHGVESVAHQVTKSALDPIACHGVADGPTHDETDAGGPTVRPQDDVGDQRRLCGSNSGADGRAELVAAGHPLVTRKHRERSGRQLCAALATTVGQDGPAGAGAHAEAEAVLLGTTTVVGLVGALAHDRFLQIRAGFDGHREPTIKTVDGQVVPPLRGHAAVVVHRTDTQRYGRLAAGSNRPTFAARSPTIQTTRRRIPYRIARRVVTRRRTLLTSRRYGDFHRLASLTEPSFTSCGKLCGHICRTLGGSLDHD